MSLLRRLRSHWLSSLLALGLAAVAFNEWRTRHCAVADAHAETARPPSPSGTIYAEGRIVTYPDSEVTLAAGVAGRLARLSVVEKSTVKAGETIAEIDVAEQQAALFEAAALVKEAETGSRYFRGELERSTLLVDRGAVSRAELERSSFQHDQATAHQAALRASLARLDAVLKNAKIIAPIDGVVTERFVDRGESVMTGERVLTIADLNKLRVEAEVVEYDIGRIKEGATATLQAEGLPGEFRATVEEVPDTVVPRRIRPDAPGRLVDVRVVLVKLKLDGRVPLKLGQRVEVRIQPTALSSAP